MPFRRRPEGGDIAAVFIHAGAGYHSHQNEKIHLRACHDAATTAMAVLRNGGTAVEAVEFAIRTLEDRDITNAGYGSNLTIEGKVECDATMVDHLGRSGAVGAVSQVKNPVSLARVVLEESLKPLSMARTPPNLIVGPGATSFAGEHGLPVLPHEFLIAPGAQARYEKWKKDMEAHDRRERENQAAKISRASLETADSPDGSNKNLTPPTTPETPSPQLPAPTPLSSLPVLNRPLAASAADLPAALDSRVMSPIPDPPKTPPILLNGRAHVDVHYNGDAGASSDDGHPWESSAPKRTKFNGSFDGSDTYNDAHEHDESANVESMKDRNPRSEASDEDRVDDTVGAIAIDGFGHIAAASSSGGIGMKHQGRCGPAALVGIGTAVIPADPNDPEQLCVAAVASGTGEHMATTAAAATAAERLYNSVRKINGKLESCSEEEAMLSLIKNDFMKHPGVQTSPAQAAIGLLVVKKNKDGIGFHFGHNTDSFALSSFHSEERKPLCSMSRNHGNSTIAMGGRVSRSKHARRR